MRVRLEAAERAQAEPIAIVGIGCRFPGGARRSGAFWRCCVNGVDAIDRGAGRSLGRGAPLRPGSARAREDRARAGAASSSDVDGFDAAFFGISPREAARMDPQQRLLLEVAWEALEDAGSAPARLAGQPAGVFVGRPQPQHRLLGAAGRDRDELDAYAGTGHARTASLAGRLSYLLDLRGPSLAVDTACSSSLVAVHLACQSLRAGECDAGAGRRAST